MNVQIYTKRDCGFCTKAKMLLDSKGIAYKETVIGEDILREVFIEIFPNVKTVPLILIDGNLIESYQQLKQYIDNRPQLLNG